MSEKILRMIYQNTYGAIKLQLFSKIILLNKKLYNEMSLTKTDEVLSKLTPVRSAYHLSSATTTMTTIVPIQITRKKFMKNGVVISILLDDNLTKYHLCNKYNNRKAIDIYMLRKYLSGIVEVKTDEEGEVNCYYFHIIGNYFNIHEWLNQVEGNFNYEKLVDDPALSIPDLFVACFDLPFLKNVLADLEKSWKEYGTGHNMRTFLEDHSSEFKVFVSTYKTCLLPFIIFVGFKTRLSESLPFFPTFDFQEIFASLAQYYHLFTNDGGREFMNITVKDLPCCGKTYVDFVDLARSERFYPGVYSPLEANHRDPRHVQSTELPFALSYYAFAGLGKNVYKLEPKETYNIETPNFFWNGSYTLQSFAMPLVYDPSSRLVGVKVKKYGLSKWEEEESIDYSYLDDYNSD